MQRLQFAVGALGLVLAGFAWGDETCGLQNVVYDGIFFDGFQAAVDSGLGPPLTTVPVPTLGTTPTIAITYPTATSTNIGQTSVIGTYTGPAVSGVSINGTPAFSANGSFVVPRISLASGSNTITATVSTLDGLSQSAQFVLTYNAASPDLTFVADRPIGPAPQSVGFVLTIPYTISSSSIDFGDGSAAFTGSTDSIPRHTYSAAGAYTALASVVDTSNITHQVALTVGVYDVAQVRTKLCSVYAYLRGRLVANDAAGALQAFSPLAQDRYHDYLTAGTTNLPNVAGKLGTLAAGLIAPTYAQFLGVLDQSGTIQASPVQFIQGSDGVWRIDSL